MSQNSINNSASALTVTSFGAGVVQSNSSGVLASSNGSNGQVIIGGGSAPAWASLTAGTNITLTPGANTLTIAASGGGGTGITWNVVADPTTTVTMVANNGYIYTGTMGVQFTLPATSAVGSLLYVTSAKTATVNWGLINVGVGQSVVYTDSSATDFTTSALGSVDALGGTYTSIELVCTIANISWTVLSNTGTLLFS